MLKLKDFFHLSQVEPLIEELVADGPGLTVIAGLDPRPASPRLSEAASTMPTPPTPPVSSPGSLPRQDTFLPSGRAALFRILMREILTAQPGTQAAIVAATKDTVRIPRSLRRRVQWFLVSASETYAEIIAHAASPRPALLVIDRLSADSTPATLEAASSGLRVLSQLDTVFRGSEVARHLLALGAPRDLLDGLAWVLSMQRLATLCPVCREPDPPDPARLAALRRRYPELEPALEGQTFYRATGCQSCRQTGREGEIAAFDIYCTSVDGPGPLEQSSLLPLEAYLLGLATRGYLSLDDLLHFETDQLRRTYNLLTTGERALAETNTELERRLAELRAANRVLQQRTEALVSLESIGQALITSTGLGELAAQLCRNARDLCGADRSILYYRHPEEGIAKVLAECGWDPSLLHQPLDAAVVFPDDAGTEPTSFGRWPPGVPKRPTDVTAEALRAGLRVPLAVQDSTVGLMIVHSSLKSRFTPGEIALLQTFANQAAVAIQRAGLVDALQEKIAQLEAAQAELVKKERIERELELAREVQQSVLPRVFPRVPGYAFAARSEPARWVGGDFYDVIPLDADRFGLVVGDVSGKGMPAALYMAQTHSLLLAEAHREESPRAVLHRVHHLSQELGRSGMFVTVFYGIVDGAARRLTYARAGHDRPLLLRGGEVQSLRGEGTVIGFPDLDDLHLTEEQIDLNPRDRLVLYTDGVIDTVAPDGQPFGLDRLASLLRTHADLSPPELCAATFADLTAYQANAEQFDDTTLLIVGVT